MASFSVLNVYDNGALPGTDLIGAKGQGMLIDIDGERTLFDTGMRGRYLMNNLATLKVDVESIDRVVISHGHRDHAGGLPALLDARETPLEVVVHPLFHRKRARGFKGVPYRMIGPPRLLEEQEEKMLLREEDRWTSLSESMLLVTAPPRKGPDAISDRLLVKDDGGWRTDEMDDEISLALSSDEGLVVLTGCCHRGILGLLGSLQEGTGMTIAAVIGGLHMNSFTHAETDHVVRKLQNDHGEPSLHLNHCTGEDTITRMRQSLGLRGVKDFYTGTRIDYKTGNKIELL